jgi:hypothetical protein
MRIRRKMIFILMTFCLVACAQTKNRQFEKFVNFDKIIEYFEEYAKVMEETIVLPLVYKSDAEEYSIEISDTPISFDIKEIVIKNPFDDKFPVSFSVIYKDRLISLFEQGKFVCHTIPSMQRDIEFEKEINTKNFEYHWIIEGKLVGRVKNKYYFLDSDKKWIEHKNFIPIKNQPKLFEDNNYISFCDCHGEWGGTVYFYNKLTEKIYFTEATCANSIIKKNEYFVLSHLGHGMGSSELKSINFPDNLSLTNIDKVNTLYKGEALGYTDKSTESKIVFDYYWIQIFSSFPYQGRTIYMVYWRDRTFLAEIENNVIKIINPLLNREIYTHDPITITYDDIVLMNLDFYGIAREREVSCIIIKDEQLIKIDWNKKHSF